MGKAVAIIGGTGVYDLAILEEEKEISLATPYGKATLRQGTFQGQDVYFMARHGPEHSVPPHKVNYRANIWSLKHLGVERILATAAVGSLRRHLEPGQLVLVDQFLDFTKRRPATFFDGEGGNPVVHIDFTEPYCLQMRELLRQAAADLFFLPPAATYVCTEGPRFETPAEINMFSQLGGDLVGMTGVPEVVLAREAGLCYATVAMVTNYAAGLSKHPLTHKEVLTCMAANMVKIRQLLTRVLPLLLAEARSCTCQENNRYWEGS